MSDKYEEMVKRLDALIERVSQPPVVHVHISLAQIEDEHKRRKRAVDSPLLVKEVNPAPIPYVS